MPASAAPCDGPAYAQRIDPRADPGVVTIEHPPIEHDRTEHPRRRVNDHDRRDLRPGGPIARSLPGFEARPGQVQMAQLIERGILENVHTIVEAGTGVGKSLAYLVPALRSGKKIVISTGTIALQEQLVRKDIPLVSNALGIAARVVLLKGRNHYLCRQKYEKMSAERLVAPSAAMEKLWAWAERTGDRRSRRAGVHAARRRLGSARCRCRRLRRRISVRASPTAISSSAAMPRASPTSSSSTTRCSFSISPPAAALLPAYDVAILDEAHQCEKYATAALTASLSPSGVGRMMRKLHRTYAVPASYDAEIDEGDAPPADGARERARRSLSGRGERRACSNCCRRFASRSIGSKIGFMRIG